jgi:hypothetical protein
MSAFLGMRGTGDWPTNYVPESWRETLLYEYPNGSMPITGMMSMFKSEEIPSTKHHWFTQSLPTMSGAVTAVYINSDLSTAYVWATHQATMGIEGSVVYVKMAAALAAEFAEGMDVLLKDADKYDVDIVGSVVDVVYNGASSYVAVKLYEADDNCTSQKTTVAGDKYNLSTVDTIIKLENSSPQGSALPRSVMYDATEYYNYTGIQRNPLELTNTAIATEIRPGDAYKEAKRQAFENHGIGLEKKAIWSIRWAGTGMNGKPKQTPGGLLWFTKTYASSNVDAYHLNSTYTTQTWLSGGEVWLDTMVSQFFRYAPSDKAIAVCGDGAMLGIQRLAKNGGQYQLGDATKSYGISVVNWKTFNGTLPLKSHPLFSQLASTRNAMLIYCPQNVRFMPLRTRDTKFEVDQQARGVDAKVEAYTTEFTFEFRFPNQFMYLEGVGLDNVV